MFDIKLSNYAAVTICILLLCTSCCLMITAWYFHLKFDCWPFWMAILISWTIALPEYCCMIPANRIGFGSGALSVASLKAIAEVKNYELSKTKFKFKGNIKKSIKETLDLLRYKS